MYYSHTYRRQKWHGLPFWISNCPMNNAEDNQKSNRGKKTPNDEDVNESLLKQATAIEEEDSNKLTIKNQFPGWSCLCRVKILATQTVKVSRMATVQTTIANPRSPLTPLISELKTIPIRQKALNYID